MRTNENYNYEGTVQFMAVEVLKALSRQQSLERKAKHDLESFIWVMAYAVRRRLCHAKLSRSGEMISFRGHFGQLNIKNIYGSRKGGLPLEFSENIPKTLLSETMRTLFELFGAFIEENNSIRRPLPLTHDSLITALDNAITELEH